MDNQWWLCFEDEHCKRGWVVSGSGSIYFLLFYNCCNKNKIKMVNKSFHMHHELITIDIKTIGTFKKKKLYILKNHECL